MKAFLGLVVMLLAAAATALAYGGNEVTHGMTAVAVQVAETSEPAALLLSGSLLLGLAGAVRRFTV